MCMSRNGTSGLFMETRPQPGIHCFLPLQTSLLLVFTAVAITHYMYIEAIPAYMTGHVTGQDTWHMVVFETNSTEAKIG